jgi:hypothetical protein
LAQDVHPEDLNHPVFDEELRHDLMNRLWQANLHVGVENWALMVCAEHPQMGDALQNAQDALLALNY